MTDIIPLSSRRPHKVVTPLRSFELGQHCVERKEITELGVTESLDERAAAQSLAYDMQALIDRLKATEADAETEELFGFAKAMRTSLEFQQRTLAQFMDRLDARVKVMEG